MTPYKTADKAIQDDDILGILEAGYSELHFSSADELQRTQECRPQRARPFNFVRSFSGCGFDLTAADAGLMTLHPCNVEA